MGAIVRLGPLDNRVRTIKLLKFRLQFQKPISEQRRKSVANLKTEYGTEIEVLLVQAPKRLEKVQVRK